MQPATVSFPADIVVPWLAEYAGSNCELALLTNINSGWREHVVSSLIATATKTMEHKSMGIKDASDTSLLLLPSLIAHILEGRGRNRNAKHIKGQTFCLSWFHPEGMRIRAVPRDDSDDSDAFEINTFIPTSDGLAAAAANPLSHDHQQQQAQQANFRNVLGVMEHLEASTEHESCIYQWNSYTEAADVLAPFGFTRSFTKTVLHQCQKLVLSIKPSPEKKVPSRDPRKPKETQKYSSPAVRGVTVARPEGYCLCWDDENLLAEDGGNINAQQKRSERKRQVDRELLPRVIRTIPSYREMITSEAGMPSKTSVDPQTQQLAVQFLDSSRNHAVRMFTLPFDCGDVPLPVTIFCVGIATEDGCFFSGLNNRFEFGHMYPATPLDVSTERSAACICTDNGDIYENNNAMHLDNDSQIDADDDDDDESQCDDEHDEGNIGNAADGHDDYNRTYGHSLSDDSSVEKCLDDDIGLYCDCQFKKVSGWDDDSTNEEDLEHRDITRGNRGPGSWHCYSIVFDGVNSVIRIDGMPEKLRSTEPPPSMSHPSHDDDGDNDDADHQNDGVSETLGGFTIGSDHLFDMSLCFGQGSDGEGEGAISELAAFKGRLELPDIETIERHLMKKHGIQSIPSERSRDAVTQVDQFKRRSQFLLSNPPSRGGKSSTKTTKGPTIPLRYLARNRLVSWRQYNPVTGQKTQIPKIGCRYNGSSSDW